VQDRWLALLVFAAAALKSHARDHWIGQWHSFKE
jgi:hypothetical protein